MRIVNVNSQDTGNQCFKLSKAINETFPGLHESRAFTGQPSSIAFEQDVAMDKRWQSTAFPKWITEYWLSADVIHRHAKWKRSAGWPPASLTAGRIIHQHGRYGSAIKLKAIQEADKRLKQIRVVSTLNLLAWVNNNFKRWFPPPMDIVRLDKIKRECQKTKDRLIIAHSPTQRERKHTNYFLYVMKEIRKKYPKVQVCLIEGKTHAECLRLRANADICYDQLLLQYGTSGLEAMTMGQPVIAGCADALYEKMTHFFGTPPFVRATKETLFTTIERLIIDEQLRTHMGKVGRNYIETYHSFKHTAELAIDTYKEAKEWMSCSVQ